MLLFTAILVFYKLTILERNYTEETSGRLDMTFLCKQNPKPKTIMFAFNFVDPDLWVDKEAQTD